MAVGAQAEHEIVAIDALDRRFAGGIDVGDDHGVGVVEAGAEFLEQRLQARVAMRLHHGDDLACGAFARGAQHGGNLHGMMAVVVDDGDAVPLAGLGEAALDAAEAGDGLADRLIGHAEFMRDGNRRRGIQCVVTTRHRQQQIVDLMRGAGLAIAERDLEA